MKSSRLLQNFKYIPTGFSTRWIHPKAKFKLKEDVEKLIESEQIKPRQHPGIIKKNVVVLPEWILEAMDQSLDDTVRPQIYKESKTAANYLFSRRLPPEVTENKTKYSTIERNLMKKFWGDDLLNMTEEEIEENRKKIKGKVLKTLNHETYAWKAIEYTHYQSLLYMITRSAAEYSVLHSIFNEIKIRNPEFQPQTIFDFGSGVGTVLWAALNHWNKSIGEYIGVDISSDMNDLSTKIMSYSPKKFKGLFHREYLPVSNLQHDIVISAYSLMELPSMRHRLEVVAKLWKKTNKYLIFVEQGTNAGFQIMNEARSFIQHVQEHLEPNMKYNIFAPCPHKLPCPRYSADKTPCNFITQYQSLPLLGSLQTKKELFTYIVFKKDKNTDNENWYRLVRPTMIRSKHARCQTCTPDGKLEEIVFTQKKHGKACYRCAKVSKWGDRLPIEPIIRSESVEVNVDNDESAYEEGIESSSDSDSDEQLKDEESAPKDEVEFEVENEETLVSNVPHMTHKK